MAGTTSGVVGGPQSTFTIQQTIDRAARRAGRRQQKLAAEELSIALEALSLLSTEWINAGFPLWTRQYYILGCTIGSPEVTALQGTAEILRAFWRQFNPWRGAATDTTGASQSVLFAGQPNSDVTITASNPGVTVNFGTATEVDTVGILLGGSQSITAALTLLTSTDGVNFTTAQTLPSTTYTPGQWQYFDLDPSITSQYLQIQYMGASSWTLNQLNFCFSQGTSEEIGPLNIDDYWRLPNYSYQGNQSVSAYQDRQLDVPVLKLWPVPNTYAFYNAAVGVLSRRYIQDPGTLTNRMEVPARWSNAVAWRLATMLMDELPDEEGQQASFITLQLRSQRLQRCDQQAQKAEALAWAEERTRGPIRLAPSIACYTR